LPGARLRACGARRGILTPPRQRAQSGGPQVPSAGAGVVTSKVGRLKVRPTHRGTSSAKGPPKPLGPARLNRPGRGDDDVLGREAGAGVLVMTLWIDRAGLTVAGSIWAEPGAVLER